MELKQFIFMLILSYAGSVCATADFEYEYGLDDNDGPPPRLEDVPDKYYDDLMKEVPHLGKIYSEYNARRNTPAYNLQQRSADKPYTHPSNASQQSGRRIFQRFPYGVNASPAYLFVSNDFITQKVLYQNKKHMPKANCFWCGMNVSHFVPTTSICHDAFESQDFRMRAIQRFLRGKCYYTNPTFVNFGSKLERGEKGSDLPYYGSFQGWNNLIYGAYYHANQHANSIKGKWGWGFYWDYGLKRNFYGQYMGGCFKRYLDVSNVYTQRGCRHYWPIDTYGASSINHRFKKLEYVLRWQTEGCISSPQASLTPFNRGISLFVRYHVCVCQGRYCNRAGKHARPNDNMLLAVAILLALKLHFHVNLN